MTESKTIDASLWWDSFTALFTELENSSLSSDLPENLVKKLKAHRSWFVNGVSFFKTPNEKSREALNSLKLRIGSHELTIQPELKDKALHISGNLGLDEVQSYILAERSVVHSNVSIDSLVEDLHVVLLKYYMERQCLLKCTRWILMHALYVGNGSQEGHVIREEARTLFHEGLESKLLLVLQGLLSCSYSEKMDVDLFTLWAEETLIEDNLVLDILFLAYYDSFCTCNGERWKALCSLYKGILSGEFNFGMLAITSEALDFIYHAKSQLLLILMETLDLESLLQMVYDEIPFRQGTCAFSINDVQEMDTIVSSLNSSEIKEVGPLLFMWAVFLCLISTLPEKDENSWLMEIDHSGYARQAFEAGALSYFHEILQCDILKESDGPVAGYRSVLRTSISAFIASYEINLQLEDGNLDLILDILCKIYRGEESLCTQFWDKRSFVDGPIRSVLYNLEGEFPYKTVEFVRFLSSLCEGPWPAECVYNFLDKSVGVSSMFEISSGLMDDMSNVVEAKRPVQVPGIEGLFIPPRTRGYILRDLGRNTALVRWEYAQSGVFLLLCHLAQDLHLSGKEEVVFTLDLLSRLVEFNTDVCFALMEISNPLHVQMAGMNEQLERTMWFVEIICSLVKNLHPNAIGARIMSMGIKILGNMLNCCPSNVTVVALKANIFDIASQTNMFNESFNGLSSGSWLLSGKLAKMLLVDCELYNNDFPLAISVLEFTMQLVKTGWETDAVFALIVFSLQYVLVNHENWKFSVKHIRWRITLKALELMKTCLKSIPYYTKLGVIIHDLLFSDSSIHSTLFQIVSTTTQALEKLCINRLFELMEIEGLQLAIGSVLDIVFIMLSKFPEDSSSGIPVFYQEVFSCTAKPLPVVTAVISLISYTRDPDIQIGAARVISMLFIIADYLHPHLFGNPCFGLDVNQIMDLRHTVSNVLLEQSLSNEDLFVATVNMLTAAAHYQPAFLVAVFNSQDNTSCQLNNASDGKQTEKGSSSKQFVFMNSSLIDAIRNYVEGAAVMINSNPRILLSILNFMNALWQGGGQYTDLLESMKTSTMFWKHMSNPVSLIASSEAPLVDNLSEKKAIELSYKYLCQSAILGIMACDLFLQKKILHVESFVKGAAESGDRIETTARSKSSQAPVGNDLRDIWSSWCETSILEKLIKSCANPVHDNKIYYDAKVASSLLLVHVIERLANGDSGSLSVSFIQKIRAMSKKLTSQSAFSELLTHYSQHNYSERKELNKLILSDLYYQLQGELEGRKIGSGPFKELSQYLLESNFFGTWQYKFNDDFSATAKNVYLFDLTRIRADLGLDMWDRVEWKESTQIAEIMLQCLQHANSLILLSSSKLSILRTLNTILAVYRNELLDKKGMAGEIPNQLVFTCIDLVCQYFHATVESLALVLVASEGILDTLAAQAELLLHLMKLVPRSLSSSVSLLVLKSASAGLRVLCEHRASATVVDVIIKLLLLILLSALESNCFTSQNGATPMESCVDLAKVSNETLGLLSILCNCISATEHCMLSLTIMDLILRNFLMPSSWLPIIRNNLQLQLINLKLQDKSSLASISIIMKFFLTLARVNEGAEMLFSSGFLASLRLLFAGADVPVTNISSESLGNSYDKIEKPQNMWGLSLAVVTAMVQSLGDSSCKNIVESMVPYFFFEKAHLVSLSLSAPDVPYEDHEKKRARALRSRSSLTALKETEHTLMLMCELAKSWTSWIKTMKEMDAQLREKCIHLLAFISQGTQRLGESSSRNALLLCPPTLKDEFENCSKPSYINSKAGWFALTPFGCFSKPKFSCVSNIFIVADQATEGNDAVRRTHFSDTVAIQVYRITFLLLKFLCLEAEFAAKRSEEVGFVDLAHFPELPMPEILHGVQDQTINIVTELCLANKSNISPEIQNLCCLLLQITEMALHLELCVMQICSIRPVLGRVEDFTKEVKSLFSASEGQSFLKAYIKSLKQIIACIYPGLLQAEGFW